jgi:hypothetical protein
LVSGKVIPDSGLIVLENKHFKLESMMRIVIERTTFDVANHSGNINNLIYGTPIFGQCN